MSNPDLKQCPFCGSDPSWCGDDQKDRHDCHQIVCGCGIQFDATTEKVNSAETMDECREEMKQIWNTRAPITREQANEWAAGNGFAMVPVEPTWKMECAGDSASHTLLPLNMATNIYKAMIKAAQESS